MPLSDINVDRKLTHKEVVVMLAEDAKNEDVAIAKIKKDWVYWLKRCWRSKEFCDRATDKVRVKVWKEERTYVFVTKDKRRVCKQSLCGKKYGYRCITDISYLTAIPRQSQFEEMSIAEIEEISAKFVLKDSVIKCLLDAGFTLDLIVPSDFLGL